MSEPTSHAAWRRNLKVLWLGQFTVTAGLTVVVPLLPFYLRELGLDGEAENRRWTGWALAAPAIPLMLMAPIWGRLGDRWGRKPMVVRALFGISLSVIAMGLAASPLQFFLFRLAQGTFGGVDDAAASFASTETPAAARGRAIGFLQSATAAGALVGPLGGGLLSGHLGFAPLIVATGVLTAACGLLALCLLRETRGTGDGGPAATRSTRAVARELFRDPGARALLLAGLSAQTGTYALIGAFAARVHQLTADVAAGARWVGTLSAIGWTVTLLGAAWWGRRNDRRPVERNFALAAAGCAGSVMAHALPSTALGFLLPRVGHGFFGSALGQSVYLRVGHGAPAADRGLRIGIANSLLTLGQVLGALGGAAVGSWISGAALFVVLGLPFALAAVVAARAVVTPVVHPSSEPGT